MFDQDPGPVSTETKVKRQELATWLQYTGSHGIFQVDPIIRADNVALFRDIFREQLIFSDADEIQKNFPATQRNIMRKNHAQILGVALRGAQKFLNQVLGRREIGSHDFILAGNTIPVVALRDGALCDDMVSFGTAFNQERASTIGDHVVENLSFASFRQDIRADT